MGHALAGRDRRGSAEVGGGLTGGALHARRRHCHFIRAFTGSHHFILDYRREEVLQQQPGTVRSFLQSSILDKLNRRSAMP
jgi:ATP/maltotriose-dependent transcriptional regulator MalT